MNKNSSAICSEINAGDRYAFGENWEKYARIIDEDKINQAVKSLKIMLESETLLGKTFLDVGSGSGLFSLVPRCFKWVGGLNP